MAGRSQETAEPPREIVDGLIGAALLAAPANVVMQLALLPVGRGVAESRVESGRVDRHPVKRTRTTTAYLALALLGTDDERAGLRCEIDRVHAAVRSRPGDPVAYDAFDIDLQLWVAACLYRGVEDVLRAERPRDEQRLAEVVYPYCHRLATTLQVPVERWPADRAAFERYWSEGVERVEMDAVTRRYLLRIADQSFLFARLGPMARPLAALWRPLGTFVTSGWLPSRFREELGLAWGPRRERWHRSLMGTVLRVARASPWQIREFPFNASLAHARRRLAGGEAVV